MIRRRALAAEIETKIGNHSFRATGITAYLKNGGKLEIAQQMADGPEAVDRAYPGTTKLHRMEENIGAAAIELTVDDLREIRSIAEKIDVQGTRCPEQLEQMTGR